MFKLADIILGANIFNLLLGGWHFQADGFESGSRLSVAHWPMPMPMPIVRNLSTPSATIVIREFQNFLNLVNKTCITYPETPKFFTWMLEGLINPNIQLFLGEVKRGLQRTKSASESPKIREFQTLVTPCHCGENPSDQSKLTRVTGAFCHKNGRSSSPRANTRPRHKFLRRGSYITFINKSKKIEVFSSILWAKMWVLNKLWPSSRSWLSIYIPLTCFLLLIFWDS